MPVTTQQVRERVSYRRHNGLGRGRLAQLVRAPALQAGCRGFESLAAHQSMLQDQPGLLLPGSCRAKAPRPPAQSRRG
jgi:hypothetical protein